MNRPRPDMEKTLKRISAAGWRDFYDGQIAGKIVDHIQQTGGILTREDMAQYKPRITEPYKITYGDAEVYDPILTNGCLTSLQVLNMLDCLDLVPDDTPAYWHCLGEVLKLAWRTVHQCPLIWIMDTTKIFSPVSNRIGSEFELRV